MGIVFIWKKEYAVGIPELDKQHQDLFNLGNKLQNIDKSQAKPYVMDLYKYARAHFKAEEEHMEQLNYPNLKAHRELHNKFITDLNLITKDFTDDSFYEFKSFLNSWLIDHVLTEDSKYFDYSHHQDKV